jgi:hypothetical protein
MHILFGAWVSEAKKLNTITHKKIHMSYVFGIITYGGFIEC